MPEKAKKNICSALAAVATFLLLFMLLACDTLVNYRIRVGKAGA